MGGVGILACQYLRIELAKHGILQNAVLVDFVMALARGKHGIVKERQLIRGQDALVAFARGLLLLLSA